MEPWEYGGRSVAYLSQNANISDGKHGSEHGWDPSLTTVAAALGA